jgi:hypothetical protein
VAASSTAWLPPGLSTSSPRTSTAAPVDTALSAMRLYPSASACTRGGVIMGVESGVAGDVDKPLETYPTIQEDVGYQRWGDDSSEGTTCSTAWRPVRVEPSLMSTNAKVFWSRTVRTHPRTSYVFPMLDTPWSSPPYARDHRSKPRCRVYSAY